MRFPDEVTKQASAVLDLALLKGVKIRTAESCTGGLVGAALTAIPGSSAIFDRGFATYSYAAKHEQLGVAEETIREHGAVSGETAKEMLAGALAPGSIAVSITGIAGPGGGMKDKPVGMVWFGVGSWEGEIKTEKCVFPDKGRDKVRYMAMMKALELLKDQLEAL